MIIRVIAKSVFSGDETNDGHMSVLNLVKEMPPIQKMKI